MELKSGLKIETVDVPLDGVVIRQTSIGLLVVDYADGKPVKAELLRQKED